MTPKLGKTLRYFAFGILALALVSLLAVSYLVLTFDPSDYRDDLINRVEERTGRTFAINGPFKLYLNPPLVGLEVHDISLDNPAGFGQGPMLSAKRGEIYLRVIPLLMDELHIHSVRLDGLQLRLRRKSNGHSNWASLLAEDFPGGPGGGSGLAGSGPLPDNDLTEIHLNDSSIAVWDELRNRRMRGSDIVLRLEGLTPGGNLRLEVEGKLAAWPDTRAENRVNAQVQLATSFSVDRDEKRVVGENLSMVLELTGPLLAVAPITPTVQVESFAWNLATDVLRAGNARVELDGAQLQLTSLDVKSLRTHPDLVGHVEATEIDVLHWLTLWNAEVPAFHDPAALRSLKLESDIRVHPKGVALSNLDAMLDSTSIRGEISLLDFEQPRLALDLKLSEMDLNDYLPQAWEAEAEAQSEGLPDPDEFAAAGGNALPVDWLRRQRVVANVEAGHLHWQGLEIKEARARLTARQGRWEIETLTGRINDGLVQAGARLDVSKGIPTYRLDLELEQMELGRVLELFDESGHPPIEGTTDLNMALDARGHRRDTFWSSLTGFIGLTVRNGVLQVGGLAKAVESAVAALQERPSATTPEGSLPFDLLLASWDADDGRLTSRELKLDAGAISLDGMGHIDLPQSSVDYQLNVWSGDSLWIPVRVKGPFENLSHSMDMSSLVEEQLSKGLKPNVGDTKRNSGKSGKVLRRLIDDLL